MKTEPVVRKFENSAGARIYQIPLQAFPGFWVYAYLVLVGSSVPLDYCVLIDCGSGFDDSNDLLESGLYTISELEHRTIGLVDLTHIFITHGHIDHFGGLSYVRSRTPARIGVHELDYRILSNYEETLVIASRRLSNFLIEAGVPGERRNFLLQMYKIPKMMYRSVLVDFTYTDLGMSLGPFEFFHVPGHCAGHVIIRLKDVLFSGDHILSEISPHQSPESITASTGLTHYLQSLESVRLIASQVLLTLAGHQNPILNLVTRLDAIQEMHKTRLVQVLDHLVEPHTIQELSQTLFGEVHGYNVLLALEETGAHVEYLYQRGLLGITNLVELESSAALLPIRYHCNKPKSEVILSTGKPVPQYQVANPISDITKD